MKAEPSTQLQALAKPEVYVQVSNLSKIYNVSKPYVSRLIGREPKKYLSAVDDVGFEIRRGETFAIAGESGSGKSTLARMVVGLLEPSKGNVLIDGQPVYPTKGRRTDKLARLQMIFQDPASSLNPRWRVGRIIAEPLNVPRPQMDRRRLQMRVAELLEMVGLHTEDAKKFPHEFSGGQRQRIAIARALSAEADFIICDEPTSALDVSVQAQIVNLMRDLQDELGLTYLFISHNFSVIRAVATRVGVMYLGRFVEIASSSEIFAKPRHPYTRLLLDAVPDVGLIGRERSVIAGEAPSPIDPPPGCPFHPRCAFANSRCRSELPALLDGIACHAVEEGRI